jgi:hypothetical protein
MTIDPLNVQIGGNHYKTCKIQPIEYCFHNKLNVCQSKVVKYITRYKDKGGIEDLKKVIHMTQLLIELEYGKTKDDGKECTDDVISEDLKGFTDEFSKDHDD